MDYPRIYPYTKTIPLFFWNSLSGGGSDNTIVTSEAFFVDLAGRENEKTTKAPGEIWKFPVGKVSSNKMPGKSRFLCNPVSSQKKSWKGWEDYTFVEVSFPFPIFSPIFPS